MRDILRRHVWNSCLALIVLAGAISMPAWAPSAYATSPWEGFPAHRAVWKIIDGNRKYQASAFAVGPRLIVTVAHNLFDVVLKAGTEKMVLVQAGRSGHIEVVGARAISTTHDLALLETATPMEHYLMVADTLHGDVDYVDLPMDRIAPSGMSGSPVLAPSGEVIAMLRTTSGNVTGGVRIES